MLDLLKENYRGKINSPHHYQTHSLLPRRASVHEDGVTYQIFAEGFENGIRTEKYFPVSYMTSEINFYHSNVPLSLCR